MIVLFILGMIFSTLSFISMALYNAKGIKSKKKIYDVLFFYIIMGVPIIWFIISFIGFLMVSAW